MNAIGPLNPADTADSSHVDQKVPKKYGVSGGAEVVKSEAYAIKPTWILRGIC